MSVMCLAGYYKFNSQKKKDTKRKIYENCFLVLSFSLGN